jgi:DNA recombination protein RmuC
MMIEIALVAGLAVAIVLLLVIFVRLPRQDARQGNAIEELMSRMELVNGALGRIEGSLQMMQGAQESRIQGLVLSMTNASDSLRAAVDEKLTQTLNESRIGRTELSNSFTAFEQKVEQRSATFEQTLNGRSETLEKRVVESLESLAASSRQTLEGLKNDINNQLKTMAAAMQQQLDGNGNQIKNQLSIIQESITQQLTSMVQSAQQGAEQVRNTLNERLQSIQTDNATRLEEMRKTVDEKLHATLEQRLGQSFQLVSERLEQVHRGLGEMQNLAAGVGDLKRVLTNVKARGIWGEVQLEAMIEQIFTPEQYVKNAATRPGSSERVEIAIRLPGREDGHPVLLPIDAKFPVEDYQRLLDAHDRADQEQVDAASKALEIRIRNEAKTICEKYVSPPDTTDFAVMYMPTEGLYSEVLRRPGLAETIQREYRVMIAGPTNLAAMLNSLQMGFRTLAIEKRASDVWQVLGQVKTEFGKFGDVISATQKKLEAATKQFDQVAVRTRAVERKLKNVEALPVAGESLASVELLETETEFLNGTSSPVEMVEQDDS